MSDMEKIKKLIDSVEATSSKPLYLVAYTDYEEEKIKEWYPGVEILRVPLKMETIKTRFDGEKVMIFSFNNNPFDKLYCWSCNKYEDWTQKVWRSKPHHVICRICGRVLRSDKDEYSPEQCGWRHFRKYGWICHSCDGHHESHYVEREKLLECISSDVKHCYSPIHDRYNGIFYNIVADKTVNVDLDKLCKAIGINIDDKYEVVVNKYQI